MLLLQVDFLRQALGVPAAGALQPGEPGPGPGLGIAPGALPTGQLNAITDVPGVRVGQVTLIEGSDIRTGVTAIVPDRLTGTQTLNAGLETGNGFGKIVGTTQIGELGVIETPVLLTGTLYTFRVADALVSYMFSLPGNEDLGTVNPVVAETNDGFLSDLRRRPVTEEHVFAALRGATAGPVEEGRRRRGHGNQRARLQGRDRDLLARGGLRRFRRAGHDRRAGPDQLQRHADRARRPGAARDGGQAAAAEGRPG